MNKNFGFILNLLTVLVSVLFILELKDKSTKPCISMNYEEKIVAITFDDGPNSKSTKTLLDGLRERNVVATFFLVGENIENNKDLVKRMYDEGHLICNHTYTHIDLSKLCKRDAIDEIEKTNGLIEGITGERPTYIRPPGGAWSDRNLFEVDMTPVFWSVDPSDWKRSDVKGIVDDVVKNTTDGSIILLHDIYDTSVAAALEIIDQLKTKGYVFVTVDEILIS